MGELFLGGTVDPLSHDRTGADVRLDTADFTTHGVIVGMTGSGKTGLGVVLVEEVLSAGVPALVIDPKGDLTNLCLSFEGLDPASFRRWVDAGQAKAAGQSLDEFAAAQAAMWREGLAEWGYGPEQIAKLHATCNFTVYTPGSQAGTAVNIVGSLQVPATDDAETLSDEVAGYVSGLLGLVGVEADPLSSREHILLSTLIHHAWSSQQSLDLATLVGQVQEPPISKFGVYELDQFFPPKQRQRLGLALNGLLASPAFASWGAGVPLDIQSLLFRPDGAPRCAIMTTAHLSDEERQFVTALVLSKLVTWMRDQSGTTDLRALVYLDEVAGYLPPTAEPPTKKPILTLMKQARAFGVGVVLATQNPVDIDYKAISNAGTWMVGRLQTERDKDRLLDGMSAAAGGVDIGALSDTISGLAKREFVLRRAGIDRPEVFTTRWAMSYLRGPLTKDQIRQLNGSALGADATDTTDVPKVTDATGPTASAVAVGVPADATPVMPVVAAGIDVRWVRPEADWLGTVGGDAAGPVYEPAVVATVQMRYDEAKAELVHDQEYRGVLFPLGETVDVSRVAAIGFTDADLVDVAPAGCAYRLTGAPIGEARTWKQVQRDLVDHLVRVGSIELSFNQRLQLYSAVDEGPEAFAARCAAAAQQRVDAARADLAAKHAAQRAKVEAERDAATDRASVVEQQMRERKRGRWLRAAGDVLGGLLGSGRSRAARVGRAAERLTRTSDSKRVDEASGRVERIDRQLAELDRDFADQTATVEAEWAGVAAAVTTVPVSLERTDVHVTQLALAWIPVA